MSATSKLMLLLPALVGATPLSRALQPAVRPALVERAAATTASLPSGMLFSENSTRAPLNGLWTLIGEGWNDKPYYWNQQLGQKARYLYKNHNAEWMIGTSIGKGAQYGRGACTGDCDLDTVTTWKEFGSGQYTPAPLTFTEVPLCNFPTQYQSAVATATQNRACSAVSECTSDEYETKAPTPFEDRACTALTECTSDEYETTAPTATSNRECTALTTCSGGWVQGTAPTATSDRTCKPVCAVKPATSDYLAFARGCGATYCTVELEVTEPANNAPWSDCSSCWADFCSVNPNSCWCSGGSCLTTCTAPN